jgi:hypothetical protein
MHPGGGKEHRGIVVGDKGLPLDLGMALGFEECYVLGTQFIGCHGALIYG